MNQRIFLPTLMVTCGLFAACHHAAPLAPGAADPNDPRTIIPDLAKAHKDKIDFAWYVNSLLRSPDPAIKAFAKTMDTDHKRLLARLTEWAKKADVIIAYAYAPGLQGTSLKSMEKMQGDLLQSDDNPTFQRDYLILTWTDLDWQRNLLAAALLQTKDPDLKAYLQDSLDTQTKEREACRSLLAKFKWQP